MSRFLYALGIMHVGEYSAKLIARNFRAIDDLRHVDALRLGGIKQIGETIARSVAGFFNNENNLRTLEALKKQGVVITNPDYQGAKQEELTLEGLTFVVTGTLHVPRKEVEDMIERLGGHVSSVVSKNTKYLIAGDEPGSKLEKARSLGVEVIDYDGFLKMAGQ